MVCYHSSTDPPCPANNSTNRTQYPQVGQPPVSCQRGVIVHSSKAQLAVFAHNLPRFVGVRPNPPDAGTFRPRSLGKSGLERTGRRPARSLKKRPQSALLHDLWINARKELAGMSSM